MYKYTCIPATIAKKCIEYYIKPINTHYKQLYKRGRVSF